MKNKRNILDIAAEILQIALNCAKKTHVMYRVNLNSKVIHEYLDTMEEAELITYNEREIKATEEGIEYLKSYESFTKYMESSLSSLIQFEN